MNSDPINAIDLALRELSETRHLLQGLITSSESFDYFRAKDALSEVRRKVRTLARLEMEMSQVRALPSNVIQLPLPPESA